MKGDFTRDGYAAINHFSRVLMQQGRVQLDADWNEQTSILLHYLHTLAQDLLGPHAGPAQAFGFGIGSKFSGLVLEDIEADPARRAWLKQQLDAGDLLIGAGRYYVEGKLAENEHYQLYSKQLGYPYTADATLDLIKGKSWLAYLDVWERHISCAEHPQIREVGLGGPDTTTRAQLVWQVKILPRPPQATDFSCATLDDLLARVAPRMRVRAQQAKAPTELCVIAPEARYRGAENQLYRVEVHRGGSAADDPFTTATFKWSRENGSVIFPVQTLAGTMATLEHLGPDQCLGLKQGDWVEAVDDEMALAELPGAMAEVVSVDRDNRTVSLKWADGPHPSYQASDASTLHPLLRRWDQAGDAKLGGAVAIKERTDDASGQSGGWLDLEDGVQIWFAKMDAGYRSGDYWLIPARVATGDVEWPRETGANGDPIGAALQPHGPHHAYAPLLLTTMPNAAPTGTPTEHDCRCKIATLPCMATT